MNSRIFGVAEFKFAIRIFKGAKAVTTATNFGQNEPILHWFHLCTRNRDILQFWLICLLRQLPLISWKTTSLDLSTPKTYYSLEKRLGIFYGAEIGAILAYFGPNFVVMATPLAPLKILLAHLKLPTPKTLLISRKMSRFLVQSWNQCNVGLCCPKFGCHGKSLCSLENSDSTFEFADPENPTIPAKNVSIV